MSQPIHITLLRHGRSAADDEQRIEGRYDSPLTQTGEAQARRRLDGWQSEGRSFDLVIASTLQRASRVGEIIAEGLQAPLELDPQWMEKDNGSLAGLTFAEADKQFPKPGFRNPYQPHVVAAADGESAIEQYCRAALALQSVIRRGSGQYLVVSHGTFLNVALSVVLGAKPKAETQSFFFAFGDLAYVDLVYKPEQDLWLIRSLAQLG